MTPQWWCGSEGAIQGMMFCCVLIEDSVLSVERNVFREERRERMDVSWTGAEERALRIIESEKCRE